MRADWGLQAEVAFATCEPGFAEFPVSVSPETEGRSRDSEAARRVFARNKCEGRYSGGSAR